jgi:hypothetical protein
MSRRRRPSGRFVLMLACLLTRIFICSMECPGREADQLRERYIAEAQTDWAAVIGLSNQLQGVTNVTLTDHVKRTNKSDGRFVVKQNSTSSLVIDQSLGEVFHKGFVRCTNPDYAFAIQRPTPESKWIITNLVVSSDDNSRRSICPEDLVLAQACPELTLHDWLLPKLVQDPEFTLRSVSPVTLGDAEMARVVFDYRPVKRRGRGPVSSGWVILDPGHKWIVREYEVEGQWPDGKGMIRGKHEYGDAFSDGTLQLKRRTIGMKGSFNEGGTFNKELVYEHESSKGAPAPDSEFRLSAFGLPEPIVKWRWGTLLFLNLAGLLCIAVALALRVRSRKAPRGTVKAIQG